MAFLRAIRRKVSRAGYHPPQTSPRDGPGGAPRNGFMGFGLANDARQVAPSLGDQNTVAGRPCGPAPVPARPGQARGCILLHFPVDAAGPGPTMAPTTVNASVSQNTMNSFIKSAVSLSTYLVALVVVCFSSSAASIGERTFLFGFGDGGVVDGTTQPFALRAYVFGNVTYTLFEGLTITTADVGNTYTANQANDSQFAGFVSVLANGVENNGGVSLQSTTSHVGQALTDALFFPEEHGPYGIDFTGATIDSIALRLNEFSWSGDSDMFWFGATMTVNGTWEPVPEPSTFALLALPFTTHAVRLWRNRKRVL